eukprot:1219469-Amphidinium_carterae.1
MGVNVERTQLGECPLFIEAAAAARRGSVNYDGRSTGQQSCKAEKLIYRAGISLWCKRERLHAFVAQARRKPQGVILGVSFAKALKHGTSFCSSK